MEPQVYLILKELYGYLTDPDHQILSKADLAHIEAVLKTVIDIYAPDTPQTTLKDLQEARRPVHAPKKSWWGKLLP